VSSLWNPTTRWLLASFLDDEDEEEDEDDDDCDDDDDNHDNNNHDHGVVDNGNDNLQEDVFSF
jgi:hypothetical protein